MNSAGAIIQDCARLGVELAADGDRLGFRPASAVTPDLRALLVRHKGELLAALSGAGPAAAVVAVAGGFDGNDVPQADDRHVFGQRFTGLGTESVERLPGDETKAGVAHVDESAVGKPDAKRDERLPVQFLGERFGQHDGSVTRADGTAEADSGDGLTRNSGDLPTALNRDPALSGDETPLNPESFAGFVAAHGQVSGKRDAVEAGNGDGSDARSAGDAPGSRHYSALWLPPNSATYESAAGFVGPADLPEPWRAWYEERAAIREHDGRQTRERAEAAALSETLAAMRRAARRGSAEN